MRDNLDPEEVDAYRAATEELWHSTYLEAFRQKLTAISEDFTSDGWTVNGEPWDSSDDEYEMGIDMTRNGWKAGLRLTLVESLCREGTLDGVAFALNLEAECGHVIGGLTPYNYTEELWIPIGDAESLAERWKIMQEADGHEAERVLAEHLEECEECDGN